MKSLKKYIAFYRLSFENTVVYRGSILVWVLINAFYLVIIVNLWLSSSSGATIGGYLKNELITYYVVALFLRWLVFWLPSYDIAREIKTGEIVSSTLIKPVSFFWKKMSEELGWHLIGPIFGIMGSLILAFLFRNYLVLEFSLSKTLIFIPAIALAILLTFISSLCLGLLGFWFTEIWAIDSLYWAGRELLSGQWIPLSFIPGVFQTLARLLPFRYMFSFPLEIFFGKLSGVEIIQGMAGGIIWFAVFVLIYKIMWQKGRRAYTAFGQ